MPRAALAGAGQTGHCPSGILQGLQQGMAPTQRCPQPRRPRIWGEFTQTWKQKCHWPDPQSRVHPLGILEELGGREMLPALMQQMLNK